MNRKLYIAFAAALFMVAACTKHSTDPTPQAPDSSHSYIFFETEVIEAVKSKAGIFVEESLPIPKDDNDHSDEFGVLGYYNGNSLFSDYTNPKDIALVYRAGTDYSYYTYDHLATWQKDIDANKDNMHYFYAFYPYSIYSTVAANSGAPSISYSLDSNTADILTAYQSYDSKATNVELEFHHRLWALDFVITNNQTDNQYNPGTGTPSNNLSVISAVLELKDIPSVGTLNIDADRTATVTTRTTKTYTLKSRSGNTPTGDDVIESTKSEEYGPLLFFPTAVASAEGVANPFKVQYKIKLEVRNPWGVEYEISYPTEGYADFKTSLTSFVAGKRYQLKVTKGNGASFTVSLNENIPWDQTFEFEHTFN